MNGMTEQEQKDLNDRIDEAIHTIMVFSFALSEGDKRMLASVLGFDQDDDNDGEYRLGDE